MLPLDAKIDHCRKRALFRLYIQRLNVWHVGMVGMFCVARRIRCVWSLSRVPLLTELRLRMGLRCKMKWNSMWASLTFSKSQDIGWLFSFLAVPDPDLDTLRLIIPAQKDNHWSQYESIDQQMQQVFCEKLWQKDYQSFVDFTEWLVIVWTLKSSEKLKFWQWFSHNH